MILKSIKFKIVFELFKRIKYTIKFERNNLNFNIINAIIIINEIK